MAFITMPGWNEVPINTTYLAPGPYWIVFQILTGNMGVATAPSGASVDGSCVDIYDFTPTAYRENDNIWCVGGYFCEM